MVEKGIINKKELKAAETRKKIYGAAELLFKNKGLDNVSVDSIVEMAGVSKGGFYVHFDSKDSLITAMINDYVNKVDLDYKTFLKSFPSETSLSDVLISFVGKVADTIVNVIGYENMKAVYKAQITRTVNTDSVMGYNRELYSIFSNIISEGIQRGEFRGDMPADMLTKHCIMALRGLTYEWCIRYPDFDLREQYVRHYEILLTGIKLNSTGE